jgi:hypothetical protein
MILQTLGLTIVRLHSVEDQGQYLVGFKKITNVPLLPALRGESARNVF